MLFSHQTNIFCLEGMFCKLSTFDVYKQTVLFKAINIGLTLLKYSCVFEGPHPSKVKGPQVPPLVYRPITFLTTVLNFLLGFCSNVQ